MKKLILIIVILALIPIGIALFAGVALEKGVEGGGTWAFGTGVHLDGASLSLLKGEVGFSQLRVENPAGFKAKDAIAVGNLDVKTQVGSLMSDVIEVDSIDIIAPEITVEVATSGTNLGALLNHLEERRKGSAEEPAAEPDAEQPGKQLHVGIVSIRQAKVHLRQSLLLSLEQTVTLPDIVLTDIGGTEKEPVTLPELLQQILGAIMAALSKTGALPDDLQQLLGSETALAALADVRKEIDALSDQFQQELDKVLDEGLGDRADELKEKAKEGLGGLFGGKGKQEEQKDQD